MVTTDHTGHTIQTMSGQVIECHFAIFFGDRPEIGDDLHSDDLLLLKLKIYRALLGLDSLLTGKRCG